MIERRFAAQIPQDLIDQLRVADNALIASVAERFARVTEEAGLAGRAEFVDLDPETDGPISEYARNFDLVVTCVHSDDLREAHMSANPDLIALRSGRPVVVVPNDYEAEGLADRALVAWDGKRSSACAGRCDADPRGESQGHRDHRG